jgi:hypothetical protein
MDASKHIGLLHLEGVLTDNGKPAFAACVVCSKRPLTLEVLMRLQLEIGQAFNLGDKKQVTWRKEHPYATLVPILQSYGIEMVDVANIWIPSPQSVSIREAGNNYHRNLLERLQMKDLETAASVAKMKFVVESSRHDIEPYQIGSFEASSKDEAKQIFRKSYSNKPELSWDRLRLYHIVQEKITEYVDSLNDPK